jgi:thioredoxin reductase (NADPH)
MNADSHYDCIILGAGPAGLTALTYLARFHRRAVALGAKGPRPRVTLIERSYNLPGYPDGITGADLVRNLSEQATECGGEIRNTVAESVTGEYGAFRIRCGDGSELFGPTVLLAMGVTDRQPDIPGIERHLGRFLRYCPICDGYEHTDTRLGVLGSGETVGRHALFLRTFSDDIAVFLHGEPRDCLGSTQRRLEQCGIQVFEPRVECVLEKPGANGAIEGVGLRLADGSEHPLSVLYGALGCDVNLEPVRRLNLKLDCDGYIIADMNGETSVSGIYAAGDISSDVSQISVAFGEAATAAIRIHNRLADDEGLT